VSQSHEAPLQVNLDDPEKEPTPYQAQWSEDLDAHTSQLIADKTAGVVATFGTPPPQRRPSGFDAGFDPNARGGSFDPRESRSFTPKSFEQLCVRAEELAQGGQWRIDVVRDMPRDPRFKGFLASTGPLSNDDFIERFGGGDYTCTLNIERQLPSGIVVFRPELSAKFSIPGNPVPIPVRQHPNHTGGGPPNQHGPGAAPQAGYGAAPGGWMPGQESEAVAVIRARAEAEREKAMFERAFNGPRGSDDAKYLTTLSESSLRMQAEQAGRTIEMMQRQLDMKAAELEQMRDEVRKTRKEADDRESEYRKRLLDAEQAAAIRVKEAREEAVRAAEVQFEGRIAQKESELRAERSEKDRIVAAEREHADRRISLAEQSFTQREASLRAEAERNLSREKDDRAREIMTVTTAYEARLNSAQRDNTRDKDAGTQVTGLILNTKDSQIAQHLAEIARLRTENDAYRAQIFKPFPAMVKEFQQIAPVLGYTHSSDQETPEAAPPAPEPPKSILEQMVANAPMLLKVAGPAVAQMMSGGAAAQQAQQQAIANAAAQAAQQQQRQQLPPAPVVVQQVQPSQGPPPRTVPTVANATMPPNVSPVAQVARRRPPAQAPAPVPVPNADGTPRAEVFEEIATPARFRKRAPDAPQPASPSDIQAMLGLVSNQAKEALENGQAPADAATLVKGFDADLAAKYTAWVDAENALVLLEREDGSFWGREDAREWFEGFWTALGQP
jgi:hypothetical protein